MFIMTYNVHRASCILHCINWYEMFSKILQCHFRLTLSLISNIWILYWTENCVMFTEITFHLCMKSFICHIIEEFCIRTIRQFCCQFFFFSLFCMQTTPTSIRTHTATHTSGIRSSGNNNNNNKKPKRKKSLLQQQTIHPEMKFICMFMKHESSSDEAFPATLCSSRAHAARVRSAYTHISILLLITKHFECICVIKRQSQWHRYKCKYKYIV